MEHCSSKIFVLLNFFIIIPFLVLDSYSKGPSGLIYGNNFDYGHYDQCISTRALKDSINGQFIIVSLEFWPNVPIKQNSTESNQADQLTFLHENDSYWSLVKV